MSTTTPELRYDELGRILKEFYWQYIESDQTESNEFISIIEKSFSYSDNEINPYNVGNFNVAFSNDNSGNGAKRFLNELKKSVAFSRVASILIKASEHTSNFKALCLLMLPYMLEKLNVTNDEITYGIRLASLVTFLVIEHSISVKKNNVQQEEIEHIKASLSEIKEQLDNASDFEHIDELFDAVDKISE